MTDNLMFLDPESRILLVVQLVLVPFGSQFAQQFKVRRRSLRETPISGPSKKSRRQILEPLDNATDGNYVVHQGLMECVIDHFNSSGSWAMI